MPAAYFLDTSALLPGLLRGAPGHTWVHSLLDPAAGNLLVLAQITEAEIGAAFYQLVRARTLKRKRADTGLALFQDQIDQGQYVIIAITPAIVRRAAMLCAIHPLKGYYAVQLACALTLRDDIRTANDMAPEAPLAEPLFLTEDQRLSAAALAEGFSVDSPLVHL